jgi:hypothetical protein
MIQITIPNQLGGEDNLVNLTYEFRQHDLKTYGIFLKVNNMGVVLKVAGNDPEFIAQINRLFIDNHISREAEQLIHEKFVSVYEDEKFDFIISLARLLNITFCGCLYHSKNETGVYMSCFAPCSHIAEIEDARKNNHVTN